MPRNKPPSRSVNYVHLPPSTVAALSATPIHGPSSFHLGGSRESGHRTASYLPVPSYVEVELDPAKLVGFTVQARVERKTLNAATSVTARIYNVTTAAVAATGSVSTSTTWAAETIVFVPVAGANKYRLEIIGGNADADILAIGYIEIVR